MHTRHAKYQSLVDCAMIGVSGSLENFSIHGMAQDTASDDDKGEGGGALSVCRDSREAIKHSATGIDISQSTLG